MHSRYNNVLALSVMTLAGHSRPHLCIWMSPLSTKVRVFGSGACFTADLQEVHRTGCRLDWPAGSTSTSGRKMTMYPCCHLPEHTPGMHQPVQASIYFASIPHLQSAASFGGSHLAAVPILCCARCRSDTWWRSSLACQKLSCSAATT